MSFLNEGFEVHDTLNPKLWDINSQLMLPEVRQKLIDIVSAFEDYIDVPINIVVIIIQVTQIQIYMLLLILT